LPRCRLASTDLFNLDQLAPSSSVDVAVRGEAEPCSQDKARGSNPEISGVNDDVFRDRQRSKHKGEGKARKGDGERLPDDRGFRPLTFSYLFSHLVSMRTRYLPCRIKRVRLEDELRPANSLRHARDRPNKVPATSPLNRALHLASSTVRRYRHVIAPENSVPIRRLIPPRGWDASYPALEQKNSSS
jgi:hypothetical protein